MVRVVASDKPAWMASKVAEASAALARLTNDLKYQSATLDKMNNKDTCEPARDRSQGVNNKISQTVLMRTYVPPADTHINIGF